MCKVRNLNDQLLEIPWENWSEPTSVASHNVNNYGDGSYRVCGKWLIYQVKRNTKMSTRMSNNMRSQCGERPGRATATGAAAPPCFLPRFPLSPPPTEQLRPFELVHPEPADAASPVPSHGKRSEPLAPPTPPPMFSQPPLPLPHPGASPRGPAWSARPPLSRDLSA